MRPTQRHPDGHSGFSLIELMIAVAILAILAAVALPAYQNSIHKSRRADALAAVAAIQQSQERWRSNNQTYSTSLTELKVAEPLLYGLTISAPTADASSLATGYIVVAEGRNGQASDDQCRRMSVKLLEGNLSYAGCGSCSALSYAASNPCWNR